MTGNIHNYTKVLFLANEDAMDTISGEDMRSTSNLVLTNVIGQTSFVMSRL